MPKKQVKVMGKDELKTVELKTQFQGLFRQLQETFRGFFEGDKSIYQSNTKTPAHLRMVSNKRLV